MYPGDGNAGAVAGAYEVNGQRERRGRRRVVGTSARADRRHARTRPAELFMAARRCRAVANKVGRSNKPAADDSRTEGPRHGTVER